MRAFLLQVNMTTNYAQQFKQQIAAAPTDPSGLVEGAFAGFKGVFRRLPMQGWIRSGRLPYFFVEEAKEALAAAQGKSEEEAKEALSQLAAEKPLTKELYEERVRVSKDIVKTVCVDPKIVDHDGELAENEVRYSDLALYKPESVEMIVTWALMGSPNVPVGAVPGMEVMSVAELASFRESGGRSTSSRSRAQVSDVRRAAKRRSRHKG